MNKHLFFPFLTTLFLILFLPFYDRPVCSGSRAFYRYAAASSARHTDIRHAKTLQKDQSYNTTVSAGDFHYYCLLSQEKDSEFTIQIQSSEKISLSFQLYDQKGNLYPPSNYSLDPVRYLLTIEYDIPAGKSWLLGLCNNKERAFSYTIKYKSKSKPDNKGSSQNRTKKDPVDHKASPDRSSQTPFQKRTINNTASPQDHTKNNSNKNTKNNNINKKKSLQNQTNKNTSNNKEQSQNKTKKSTVKNSNSKPVTKPVSKNNKRKRSTKSALKQITPASLSISDTFLQTKCGNTLTLNVSASSAKTCHIQWLFSSRQFIRNKTILTGNNSSTLALSACQKGVYIVTCRIREYKNITASCTIKIT